MADGAALFDLVDRYWRFGIHRTGSDVDHATASWMAEELASRGLRVDAQRIPFDRFVAESSLMCGGAEVEHLPVPYEWTGEITTDRVAVFGRDDRKRGGDPDSFAEQADAARAAGAEALIVPTAHPGGSLRAVNRDIGAQGVDFPVVLIAGRDEEVVRAGPTRLSMRAWHQPGHTTNVVARNGVPGRPLLLTTPLTGWFGCAGERGTGVAVLLHLVEALADLPLLVVATGGHELKWFGADRWVDATLDTDAAVVVHVGASVAVVEPGHGPERELAQTRLALTSLSAGEVEPLATVLAEIGLTLAADSMSWRGEAQSFCRLGLPLLSFTGAGLDFHCIEDTPARATTPTALARVATTFEQAARLLFAAA